MSYAGASVDVADRVAAVALRATGQPLSLIREGDTGHLASAYFTCSAGGCVSTSLSFTPLARELQKGHATYVNIRTTNMIL